MYTEYVKRLICLLDLCEKERKAELAKVAKEFKQLSIPDWFRSVNIEQDIIVELSNNNLGSTIVNTSSIIRGLRFGRYRPNIVEVLWTSKNLDLKQDSIRDWLHYTLGPALDKNCNVDLEDLIRRSMFVRSMKG